MNFSVHPHIQRTLAAIVVTDAVGFSRRMSQDEDRALAMINRDLQLIGELCEFFEGQILKTVGDGVLMYFVSAVQAAACAVEVQKTFASFANKGEGDEHFTHRVGVHLGDIFVNQQDMMGTGVNIAARLESASKPGAICMSQVVYEVVKSRLDLDARYRGKLSLKNIDESVAAYDIWPIGMRPDITDDAAAQDTVKEGPHENLEESSEESTQAIAALGIPPLNAALQSLSLHPNRRRIIKLLYSVHTATWENSITLLESIPLKSLLVSLTDRNLTLPDCRHSLYQIVRTLNRQEAYAQIAEVILDSLQAFYVKPTVEATIAHRDGDDAGLQKMPRDLLYQDIADQIDQMGEVIRMKKVLYCLCYDSWENDSDCIATLQTAMLIETLYQQVTTLQGLRNRLRAILLRLNHKAKYAPIADTIFQACQVLYPKADSQLSMPGAPDIIKLEEATTDETQINLRKKTKTRWSTAKQAASALIVSPVLMRSTVFENDVSKRSIHPIK